MRFLACGLLHVWLTEIQWDLRYSDFVLRLHKWRMQLIRARILGSFPAGDFCLLASSFPFLP
jgi:hypothetical protein